MISKKDLKSYEFDTMEDYFNYIVDGQINGNFSQVRQLIKDMSKDQKKECLIYLDSGLSLDDGRVQSRVLEML